MARNLPNTVSLYEEMVAYETLWSMTDESLKTLSDSFRSLNALPSGVLAAREAQALYGMADLRSRVASYLSTLKGFSVTLHGTFQYPERLRTAEHPIELLYYRGNIGLLDTRCISVVGSRRASEQCIQLTQELVHELVKSRFTIVSGLALGIDTVAHKTAIKAKGHTVAVIGTPINECYPRENMELQEQIAKDHLLISQVPFFRYTHESFPSRKNYFPQRNVTMAALSEATIIVEASQTSGTQTQARACIQQNKKLFLMDACFSKQGVNWPDKYLSRGAIRAKNVAEVLERLF